MEQYRTMPVTSLDNFEEVKAGVEAVDRFLSYVRPFLPDAVLAGGAPRDWLLNIRPTDYDIFASEGEGVEQFLKQLEKDGIAYEEAGEDYNTLTSRFKVWNLDWEGRSFQLITVGGKKTPLDWVENFPVNASKVLYGDGSLVIHRHFDYVLKFGCLIWVGDYNYFYEDKIIQKFNDAGYRFSSYFCIRDFLRYYFQWGEAKNTPFGRELVEERAKGFYNPFDNYQRVANPVGDDLF